MSLKIDKEYQDILAKLKEKIRQTRLRASTAVNYQLLSVYYEIGRTIAIQEDIAGWGAKTVEILSKDLHADFPDMKGLSPRNLRYMRDFALAYPQFPIIQAKGLPETGVGDQLSILQPAVAKFQDANLDGDINLQPLVAKIPWTHHIIILTKIKTPEERIFYINKTAENGWSKNILSLQIENKLYERQGKAITNFPTTMPALDSDLARETLKSPYVFDFIALSEEMKERDIEKALIQYLKKFMLELGRGFAYVGNQFNLNVAGKDYFLDLLFFNYNLNRFVVFELKVAEFEPEFAGKLNLYINAIDAQIKGRNHKPTIGVLLCKTPNDTVVKFSLHGITTPIGVAEYELSKSFPKEIRGEMPTIEELEAELDKEYEELKSPSAKRFEALKNKVSKFDTTELKVAASTEILFDIFDKSIIPLFEQLLFRLNDFNELFLSKDYFWSGLNNITDINNLAKDWRNEQYLKMHRDYYFLFRLNGLKKAGIKSFDLQIQLNYKIEDYRYGFSLFPVNNEEPFLKKLYHEQLTKEDIQLICDTVYSVILEIIEKRIETLDF
jgi:predicted nuclease of restriction endonuclease-like (RecB) superfamily